MNWFKRLCAPAHLERANLQRLRQQLFVVPSQLVRPGGVPTLRIAPSYPYIADFLGTLRRIRRLQLRERAIRRETCSCTRNSFSIIFTQDSG